MILFQSALTHLQKTWEQSLIRYASPWKDRLVLYPTRLPKPYKFPQQSKKGMNGSSKVTIINGLYIHVLINMTGQMPTWTHSLKPPPHWHYNVNVILAKRVRRRQWYHNALILLTWRYSWHLRHTLQHEYQQRNTHPVMFPVLQETIFMTILAPALRTLLKRSSIKNT